MSPTGIGRSHAHQAHHTKAHERTRADVISGGVNRCAHFSVTSKSRCGHRSIRTACIPASYRTASCDHIFSKPKKSRILAVQVQDRCPGSHREILTPSASLANERCRRANHPRQCRCTSVAHLSSRLIAGSSAAGGCTGTSTSPAWTHSAYGATHVTSDGAL